MTLPIPDSAALAHSDNLIRYIRQVIQDNNGHITFARFMELALYAPGLGYYSSGSHKLGRGGDFVTAPEISPLFAQCIARQCQQVFSNSAKHILEIGAGSGIFAKDLLLELEKLDNLPETYFILETSAELRERQQKLLQAACPHLFDSIKWLDTLPEEFSGVIFANEVMDAMPIHRFCIDENGIQEYSVAWNKDKFHWCLTPLSKELSAKIQLLVEELSLPDHYESEISLIIPGWIRSLADILKKGLILLIDYGYGSSEYYHPDRQQGTFMCFYRHHQHDDPFQYVGLQDMTAHVDFTSVAESAVAAGLSLAGYTTQGSFLLACGLLELAHEKSLPELEQYKQNQAIKMFTLPSQMGEIIKVMGLTKKP